MKNVFFILMMIILFSCSNNDVEETNSLLKAEPYTAITDSILTQPKNASLYYKRGVLLLQNDQLNFAEKDFKKAWELNPIEQNAFGVINVLKRKNADSAITFIEQA